jgi:prefoldin subunit 5
MQQDLLFNISDFFKFDISKFEKDGLRVFICGMSGSGKSNCAKVLCEEAINKNIPLFIIDSEGEYASLKEVNSNTIIIGGRFADIPIENISDFMINRIIELFFRLYESGICIIFDTGGLLKSDNRRISSSILERLYHESSIHKKPFFFIVEECDILAPQQGRSDSLDYMIDIAKRGRKRGINPVFITQRTADVHKQVISQCNIWLIGKLFEKNDINHIKDILKSSDISNAVENVSTLNKEFYLISTEYKQKIVFRLMNIKDLGETPKFGEEISLNISTNETLSNTIQDLINQSEENIIANTEREDRISQLESNIENLQSDISQRDDQIRELNQSLDILGRIEINIPPTVEKSNSTISTIEKVEIGELAVDIKKKDDTITDLRSQISDLNNKNSELNNSIEKKDETIAEYGRQLEENAKFNKKLGHIKELFLQLSDVFNISSNITIDDSTIKDLKDSITQKDNEISQLEIKYNAIETELNILKQNSSDLLVNFNKRVDFIKHPAVQETLKAAMKKSSKTVIERILTYIIQEDRPVIYQEIADKYNYSSISNIASAATILEKFLILKKDTSTKIYKIDIDIESLGKLISKNIIAKELEKKRGELFPK